MNTQYEKRPLRHRSFILTLWQEAGDPPLWRFSLENPHTSQRHGFKDVNELMQFLQGLTAVSLSDK